ncbi:MAG: U32 family peptidase, partial [Fibrobacterales bacterium]|nr:U32 family peptidase [Fibrobacterales bacterium]
MDGANARKPELLAPVGDMEMALAAVHNGADAVYVGVPGFNARGRSKDFSFDELRELAGLCRLYGVKLFLALNILVFEEELERIAALLPRLAALGADAWIVQDLGLAALARELCPDQPLHASTQATATSAESVLELERFGFSQVVLAREMWLKEIEATAKALREAGSETELECFAHGALCVAFSGQCLTSESFGGRSANRGQCAQACRLEYSLVVDGRKADLGERRFLVSPRDLESLDEVDEFRRIGVKTLKIEGRLKSPEYVAAATRAYRDRLDGKETTPEELSALSRTFSRGFFSGWLHGPAHRSLVDGRTSAHVGEFLGTVERKSKGRIFARFADPGAFVAPGDGLLLAGPKGETAGGRVHEAAPEPGGAWIRPSPDCDLGQVAPGWRVFVNDSPATERALRNTWRDR